MSPLPSRSAAPLAVKRTGRATRRAVGRWTASRRLEPSFLIVGAQRAGTTSLYRALTAHPSVVGPQFHKGVRYFDLHYDRGEQWYRGHFPLRRPGITTGEASGYYLFHPLAAERIAADLPEVRIIVMLRDPVQRAISAHRHETARGYEDQPLGRALELEERRLAGEVERIIVEPGYRSFSHQHHAYRGRGRYAEQLQRFIELVGWPRLLVLESDEFFTDPATAYRGLLDFLGLPPWQPTRFGQHNARAGEPVDPGVLRELTEYFEPHDAALARLLGRSPGWRR